MKRTVSILLSLALLFGCAYAAAEEEGITLRFHRSGFTWHFPDAVYQLPGMLMDKNDIGETGKESGLILASVTYTDLSGDELDVLYNREQALRAEGREAEADEVLKEQMEAIPVLAAFFGIGNDSYTPESVVAQLSSDYQTPQFVQPVEVGSHDGFTYYMTVPKPDSDIIENARKLTPAEKVDALVRAQEEILAHPELVTLQDRKPWEVPAVGTQITFTTTDLDGNEVKSEELFSRSKITLVNFWQTFCEPCLEEMPELDRLNREYADRGFQVIGVVTDAVNDKRIATAKEISGQYTIPALMESSELSEKLIVESTPTSYFIDGEGRVLSDPVVGSHMDVILDDIEAFLSGRTDEVPTEPEAAADGKQTWTIRVTDQNGDPVPDVTVSFCTGISCFMVELDGEGIGSYTGESAIYHVSVVDLPDGYNADGAEDVYTDDHSSSITIVITKE